MTNANILPVERAAVDGLLSALQQIEALTKQVEDEGWLRLLELLEAVDTAVALQLLYDEAHERGRAAERADVLEWARVEAIDLDEHHRGPCNMLVDGLENGAHVGAAKKAEG
jgi:hypothetical protein